MKDLSWYWHRLRAMSPEEMWAHARKKWLQRTDRMGQSPLPPFDFGSPSGFPVLRSPTEAPEELRTAVEQDAREILAGRWRAFGHLALQVDDPPRWHRDYLVQQDLTTTASAFGLNHRALPNGADVKLIWELSRWYQLLRLAQAGYLLKDERAAMKCLDWLEDWLRKNPPLVGWNWTSALEVGMRLIQFTWIDALLDQSSTRVRERLHQLRAQVLVPHVSYAWRYKSFGSSANNHLLGELVGLILALVRWPVLAEVSTSLDRLQRIWEREVLAQFGPDGGNCEQALNYQLFSFEFCWQARLALKAIGRTISPEVELRLTDAARFFWEVQVRQDPWDYGDSDSAYVSPLFAHDTRVVSEWAGWMDQTRPGRSLGFWLGDPPSFGTPLGRGEQPVHTQEVGDWWIYPHTGIGIHGSGLWWLRWDLSPLGYLSTAAHGHLDALHLSIWLKGVAFVVDPGTGAYYADPKLRAWLASRDAHNGPHPIGVSEFPRRLGPFLWQSHHQPPIWMGQAHGTALGVFDIPGWQMRRHLSNQSDGSSWCVSDSCLQKDGSAAGFSVRWQFAPGCVVRRLSDREFVLRRQDREIRVVVSEGWQRVELVELGDMTPASDLDCPLAGTVSPAFRKTERAPFLRLVAQPNGDNSCVFTTTFLASISS